VPRVKLEVDDSKQPQQQNETEWNTKQPKDDGHRTPFRAEVNKIGEEETQRFRRSLPPR